MDNYCFLCNIVKDEDVFLVCESHLTQTCRDVVGLIYVGIGSDFKGEGFIGDEDNVPVTDIYPNILSFANSIYFHLDQEDQDFIFGRCPVMLIYDNYTITNNDLVILNKLFGDYKPFLVYQKNSKVDISYVKNWLICRGSKLDIQTIVNYWTMDKDGNGIDLPLLCIENNI